MSRVAVVIPAYNAAATLQATLASVQAQSHADLDIVVVDDGSTDATAEIVRAAKARDGRIRLLQRDNAGVAAARNAGIAAASGEWIAPLDADDIWHPQKIARQLAAAAGAPSAPVFVYSWSRRIDGEGRVLLDLGRPLYRGDVYPALLYSNFLNNTSSPLIRREALEAAGGFDSGLQRAGAHGAEDLQLYLRLADAGPVEVAPGYLVGYRSAPGSMSSSSGRMRRSVDLVLEEAERRRPETPRRLRQAARMKYDLYTAGLALRAGEPGACLRLALRGLARAPALGTAEAAAIALDMAMGRVFRAAPAFLDLAPEQDLRPGPVRGMDRLRAAAIRRAIANSPLSRPRWVSA